MVKQVIIVRKDLNMSMGKAIAQGAHASTTACRDNAKIDASKFYNTFLNWEATGQTKIVLGIKNEAALVNLIAKAREANLPCSLIKDEGRTEFPEPTITCGAIGPFDAAEIDKLTKRLQLL